MSIISDYKTEKVAEIISAKTPYKIDNILVVGCGSGLEAAILVKNVMQMWLVLILRMIFVANRSNLEAGDVMWLRFPDSSFEFIYSYHSLEHIDNPTLALKEMKRVLKEGAGC